MLLRDVVELNFTGAVAGRGGCGGCGDGWASLMKVQTVDVCGNDGGDARHCQSMCTQQFTEKQKIRQLDIWTSAGYDSTLRFFQML